MEFEFDRRKSAGNKQKHGIDFVEAQAIWDDPDLLEIPASTEDEPRHLVIGRSKRDLLVRHHHIPRKPHSDHLCAPIS